MRFVLGLLGLLLPAASIHAQELASLASPLQPHRAPLAATAEVDEGFVLFVSDSVSRALYNPARLAESRSPFAYATLNPYGGSRSYTCSLDGSCYSVYPSGERTFGAASFEAGGLTWLAALEYAGAGARYQADASEAVTPFDSTRSTTSRTAELDREESRHHVGARLVAARQVGGTGYALGLFGGYDTAEEDEESRDLRRQDLTSSPTTSFLDETAREGRARIDQERFAVGVEFGVSSPRLDLVGAVAYQRHTSSYRSSLTSDSFEQVAISDTTVRVIEERSEQGGAGRYALNTASVELASALYLADGPTADALLLEASASAGGGPAESSAAVASVRRTLRGPIGDLTLESEEASSLAFDEPDLDGRSYRAALAFGYVHRRQIGRTYLTAGARASGAFGWADHLVLPLRYRSSWPYPYPFPNTPSPDVREAYTQASTSFADLALVLPFYAEVPVYRAVRVFGGGAFSYRYLAQDLTYGLRAAGSSSSGVPLTYDDVEVERERFEDVFRSDSRLYLGARLRTASGLAAQVAFQGSLSAVRYWTVSLGYHF